jgi:16S rRNA (cytosine967-C5)-methyltransferase
MEQEQRIAAKAVRRVLAGAALPAALDEDEERAANRPLVRELASGTLRFLGQLRAVVEHLAERPLVDRNLEALLWVALYQLIHTEAPPHVVVDSAVRATSRLKRTSAQGLVNALLRNFLRRSEQVLSAVAREPEARFSYPRWWIDRVCSEWPDCCAAVLDAGNVRPPLTLRVNVRRVSPDDLVAALEAQGHAARRIGAVGVILEKPRPVTSLPGYSSGWFSVQDAAAQLAAPLLDVREGMRVLDACAAPGGKTTHLAELSDAKLTAIDIDSQRLQRLEENLARLGLSAQVLAGDAAEPGQWWDGAKFDRILIDAPCTAAGVVRRHPDGKWLRRESDIANFSEQQRRLLDGLWVTLERGGKLLYATCSIFREENARQIDAFLDRHADASRIPLALPDSFADTNGQVLPASVDAEHNHDGFFYALLQKS